MGPVGARPGSGARERGAVLLAVLVVASLVASAALAAMLLAGARLRAERRRLAREEAARLALAAARGVAGWFEEPERDALRPAPPEGLADREQRRVDPDGDGRGIPWRGASPPWNVRWKDPPAAPFRPPDGPDPGDRLAGTPRGPDWILDGAADDRAAAWLLEWSRELFPSSRARLVRVLLCGPRPGAPPGSLGRVIVTAEVRLAGEGVPVRASVAGDLVAPSYTELRRPLVVAGDATLAGDVAWRRGEALVGGDLQAPAGIEDGWPGGIPWFAPDRPLRRDQDGDGTDDDADRDGTGDWAAWRALPGPVPDPWWRARIGGTWRGRFSPGEACRQPWPFGPRAEPPRPPSRDDRSGFFVACPVPGVGPPVPVSWWELAGSGTRGTARLVEDPDSPGRFRLDGTGQARPLGELLARTRGLRRIEAGPGRVEPLSLVARGLEGGLLVRGAAVRLSAGEGDLVVDLPAPGDPADPGGVDRPPLATDPRLSLEDPGGDCGGFVPGEWGDPAARARPRPCPAVRVAFRGLLAVEGRLEVEGGVVVAGQVRAGELVVDGSIRPVRFLAAPAVPDDPSSRPGPPGAPRVLVVHLHPWRGERSR